jgi:hypothetical protein
LKTFLKDRIVRLPFAVQEALERMKDKKEKKTARRALRKSKERFRMLVESAPGTQAGREGTEGERSTA